MGIVSLVIFLKVDDLGWAASKPVLVNRILRG